MGYIIAMLPLVSCMSTRNQPILLGFVQLQPQKITNRDILQRTLPSFITISFNYWTIRRRTEILRKFCPIVNRENEFDFTRVQYSFQDSDCYFIIIVIVIIIIIDPHLPRKIIGSPPVPSYAHGRRHVLLFLLWLSLRSSPLFPTSAEWIACTCTQDFGVQSTKH